MLVLYFYSSDRFSEVLRAFLRAGLPVYLAVWNQVTRGKKRTANCGYENYNLVKSFYVIKY